MITEQRRPFYNTVEPTFTVRELTSTNPIGAMQTYGMSRNDVVIDVADKGAESNLQNITKQKAIQNRAAIQKALDDLPDSGGTLLVAGLLQYYGEPIRPPQRAFVPQLSAPRPIPLAINGASPDATLANMAAATAVQRTDGYSYQVPSTVAPFSLSNLQIICPYGIGVQINGGGKNVRMYNLVIASCFDCGLLIDGFDGGIIDGVSIVNCRGDAARFNAAHHVKASLRAFGNTGRGIVTRNSNSWDAWIDSEKNGGFNFDAEDLKWSKVHLWSEAGNGSKDSNGNISGQNTVQNRLRRCQIDFSGNFSQDNGLAFDFDAYSRLACTFAGRIDDAKLAPYRLPLEWPPTQMINAHSVGTPRVVK